MTKPLAFRAADGRCAVCGRHLDADFILCPYCGNGAQGRGGRLPLHRRSPPIAILVYTLAIAAALAALSCAVIFFYTVYLGLWHPPHTGTF